jgi:hypothetical protein
MTKNKKTKNMLMGIVGGEKQNLKPKSKESPVEVYGATTSVRSIAISDIKNSPRWKVRDDLSEWKNSDFTIYFIQQFRKNIDEEWNGSRVAMILYFGKIFDKVAETLGFCDNIVLRDYIDFFIKEWGMYYWKKKGNFTLWYLKDDRPIRAFVEKYDYNDSFNKFMAEKNGHKIENKKRDKKEISKKRIEQYYLAGGENLILEYGLLVPLNWLITCKNYSIEHANLHIMGAFGSLYSRGNYQSVINETESLNPYPDSFVIKDCDIIFKKLNIEVDLKLTFSKEDWCNL